MLNEKQIAMTTFRYSELENIQIDEDFDNDNWSQDIDNALNRGFDENYPIIIDQDGVIIDGNHRFVAFQEAGRIDELAFIQVDYNEFLKLYAKNRSEGKGFEFDNDNDFFYNEIKSIVK